MTLDESASFHHESGKRKLRERAVDDQDERGSGTGEVLGEQDATELLGRRPQLGIGQEGFDFRLTSPASPTLLTTSRPEPISTRQTSVSVVR